MKITCKLYASLQDLLPPEARRQGLLLEVAEDTTPIEVLKRQGVPLAEVHLLLVNGVYLPPGERGRPLAEGDELAVWPAVAGG